MKSIKNVVTSKTSLFLFLFVVGGLISILSSPYEKDLSRLSHVSSLFFAFLFFVAIAAVSKEVLIKQILVIICLVAFFETFLTIYQYLAQKPLGLFKLGELKILKDVMQCARIPSFNGKKWIFELFKTDSPRLIRGCGTFIHPNILSSFLMTSILSSAYFWVRQKKIKKIAICLFIFLQITALFLTFSRASIGTTFLAFWGLILLTKSLNFSSKIFHGFIFSLLFLANTIVFYPVLNKRGSFVLENSFSKGSNQERINSNKLALRIVKKHYLLGIGLDHYMNNAHNFRLKNEDYKITSTIHNIYLLIAAETGLINLVFFLVFLFSIFWKTRDLKDDLLTALVMIFIGYLMIGMVDYYFLLTQKGKIMFFGLAGLIYGYASYLQSLRLPQSEGCCSTLYSKELNAKC